MHSVHVSAGAEQHGTQHTLEVASDAAAGASSLPRFSMPAMLTASRLPPPALLEPKWLGTMMMIMMFTMMIAIMMMMMIVLTKMLSLRDGDARGVVVAVALLALVEETYTIVQKTYTDCSENLQPTEPKQAYDKQPENLQREMKNLHSPKQPTRSNPKTYT